MLKVFFSVYLLIFLSGCAISDVGQVDLRRTKVTGSNCSEDKNCVLERLEHKNVSLGRDRQFRDGDYVSVHLLSALIKEFDETILSPTEIIYMTNRALSMKSIERKGEIAIVANVFEVKGGADDVEWSNNEGRVVFYEDDALEGQFFNFNNMPVYGPLPFTSYPLGVRFTIFELDAQTEQDKKIFAKLAELGSKAFPPSSVALGYLNQLGDTFAEQRETSNQFRYTQVFSPGPSQSDTHYVLEEGLYVLLREQNRKLDICWENLKYDPNTAHLVWFKGKGTKAHCRTEGAFREDSYLVFQISKNVSNTDVHLNQTGLEALIESLKATDQQRADVLETSFDFSKYEQNQQRIVAFAEAKTLYQQAQDINSPTCLADRRDFLRLIAKEMTERQVSTGDVKDEGEGATLSNNQLEYFLADLRRQRPNLSSQYDTRLRLSAAEQADEATFTSEEFIDSVFAATCAPPTTVLNNAEGAPLQ